MLGELRDGVGAFATLEDPMQPAESELRVRTAFLELGSLPQHEQEAALSRLDASDPWLAREVRSLLAHHVEDSSVLDRKMSDLARAVGAGSGVTLGPELGKALGAIGEGASLLKDGDRVADFLIVREIGRGGMGVVYEAEQDFPRRRVALKVMRPEFATESMLRRFRQEAEILGLLDHPGVARVYGAGVAQAGASRCPYIAMELVHGTPLLEHAKKLTPRGRADLIARACDAVDHAHRRGVVHRDLKPGNILVDASGQPKVLDFGVARITQSEGAITQVTGVGQIIGTLGYMSPEQVSGRSSEVDGRADVYALGAVLYEVLGGLAPIDLRNTDLIQAIERVRTHEPAPLGSVDPTLRGDVESIAAKALEKDPKRRYDSAHSMALDIRRFLRDEPVTAHPQTGLYRAGKFVRRHRALVAVTLAVLAALSAATTVAAAQAVRARRAAREVEAMNGKLAAQLEEVRRLSELESAQRAIAQREGATSKAVTSYLLDFFSSAHPEHTGGKEMTIREAVERAAKDSDAKFAEQPDALAEVHGTLGSVFGSIGDHARSAEFYERAARAKRERHPENVDDWGRDMGQWVAALSNLDRLDEGESVAREGLEEARRRGGPDCLGVASIGLRLGDVLRQKARHEESEVLLRHALGVREKELGADHRDTLVALNDLALTLQQRGKHDEALALFRRNYETTRRTLGTSHPDFIAAGANMGNVLQTMGQAKDAVPILEESVETARRVLGETHPDTLASLQNLGAALTESGEHVRAVPIYESLLASCRETLGADHLSTLTAMNNAGFALERAGKLERAREVLGELASAMLRREPDSVRTAISHANLSRVERKLGLHEASVAHGREAVRAIEAATPEGHALRARMNVGLGLALAAAGQHAESDSLLDRVVSGVERAASGGDSDAAALRLHLTTTIVDAFKAYGDAEREASWRSRMPRPEPSEPPAP
jgi:non-specific serine/threonine protein kinase/serine/threonine-protein kinase